jgi:hypothetical protein
MRSAYNWRPGTETIIKTPGIQGFHDYDSPEKRPPAAGPTPEVQQVELDSPKLPFNSAAGAFTSERLPSVAYDSAPRASRCDQSGTPANRSPSNSGWNP